MSGSIIVQTLINAEGYGLTARSLLLLLGLSIAALIIVNVPVQRFIFDRNQKRIWRTRWFLWRRFEDSMPMEYVAAIRQRADQLGDHSKAYYLVMDYVSDTGEIKTVPLNKGGGRRQDKTLERLNEWLTRPDT